MERYKKILFEDLKIDEQFFLKHQPVIVQRLLSASKDFDSTSEKSEVSGITKCFHLGSSFALLGSSPTDYNRTLGQIRNDSLLNTIDASTIVSISSLYYLITQELDRDEISSDDKNFKKISEKEREEIKILHKRFDVMNWLIGTDIMQALNIKAINENSTNH